MKRLILYLTYTIIFVTILSCDNSNEVEKDKISNEGVIEYNITYPIKNYDQTYEMFLPKVMTMTYKNNVYKNEVSTKIFSSIIISDCDNKRLTMLSNFANNKIYTILDFKETKKMLNSYPKPDIIKTDYIETIIDYNCKKYYGMYDNINNHDVELFESNEIPIKNSNWCNQYSEIKGVLLAYEIEQFGMNMEFTASSIDKHKSVSNKVFEIPEDYKKVNLERFLKEMESIFSTILN